MNEAIGHIAPGLRLRLSRPEIPPGFVPRPRLDHALAAGRGGQVILVTAGPGYGKTLAVAAWSRSTAMRETVAWLGADETSDLQSFWSDILAAVTAAVALPPDSRLRQIMPGTGFGRPELRLALDGLAAELGPITVVLDDFHRVTDPDVLASVDHLIDRQPPNLRLVLVTRVAPAALHLRRRQLDGRLIEITATQLEFTRAEASDLCVRAGSELPDAELDVLLERTQGWPAGLRLALLGARGNDIQAGLRQFSGRNDLVASYLLEEILEQVPPSDRRFLLATSIVDPITADLARALTGRADSRQVLDDLVAHNTLTVRLADRPDWFSYHPLFRELLTDRLAAENPDGPIDLQRRAATWFADAGDPISAIHHSCRVSAWPDALRVLGTQAIPLMLSPQAPALAAALAPATEAAVRVPTAENLLCAAVAQFHQRDFDLMVRDVDEAERLLSRQSDCPSFSARIVIALSRMVRARLDRLGDIVSRCDDVVAVTTAAPLSDAPAAAAYVLIARNDRAIGLFQDGELTTAAGELEGSRVRAAASGMTLMAMAADAYLALIELIGGDLPAVRTRIDAMRTVAARRAWHRQPQAMAVHAAAALLELECHDLDAAERAIDDGRRSSAQAADGGAWLILEIAAVGVAVTRGDLQSARVAGERLDAIRTRTGPLPRLLEAWYRTAKAEIAVLAGDGDMIEEAESASGIGAYGVALNRIARAKAYLDLMRPRDALVVLGSARRFAPYRLQMTEAAVLSAVASARLDHLSDALTHLGEAVDSAAPVGQVRPFVVAGPEMRMLLQRFEHVADKHTDFVRTLIDTCGGRAPSADAIGPVIDDLTEREMVVLRYLPTMYKASEIAADLFVSVNTIKTHQQSIYRKLGVSSRRDAVDRARAKNLI
ncbi:LuxR C-terminal-related transcriptional regulator [Gordonia sp. CPCC 206044]|uniref:LuxR C-terminal-related transcriptional regulator n=1 Tax=Gordonia sp. CPCC 206044 TaxID=3140793 RepID=UPI003AF3BDE7